VGGPIGATWSRAPLSARWKRVIRVAWLTPRRARIQGAIVFAAVCITMALPPVVHFGHATITNVAIERAWGGWELIAAFVIAQLAIHVIARDPLLAATQMWNAPIAVKPEPRRERPLEHRPLPSPPNVESDPFRAPPRVDLASKLVQPARAPSEAPRIDDPDAPGPSVLR